MKYFLTLCSFLLAVQTGFGQTEFKRSQDWEAIKSDAKKNKKLIFLDAYTDWCGWCKVMDKNTFSDKAIGGMMNQYFVNYKLEMEKEELGQQISLKYAITSFPTFLVFDSEGTLVYTIVGYQAPADFMKTLFELINPSNLEERPGYSAEFNAEQYPDFYLKALGMKGKKKFPEAEDFNKWVSKNKDFTKEVNFTVLKRFYYLANEKTQDLFWEQRLKIDSLFGHDFANELAANMTYIRASSFVKEKKDAEFESLLAEKLPVLDDKKELEKSYRFYYYAATENWRKLDDFLSAEYKEKGIEPVSFWNSKCWDIYEKCDDSLLIAKAAKWMEEVCKVDDDYNYLDTYAALLFKSGQLTAAKEMAEAAITKGRAENLKVKGTEELLEKIEEAIEELKEKEEGDD